MKILKSITPVLLILTILSGCGGDDADYKSGMYWLKERDNWQSAVQAFERSLAKDPANWKTNLAMVEALSRGDDPVRLEKQVVEVFTRFPDSTRSSALISAAGALLGEDLLTRRGGIIELSNIEKLLAAKGDKPDLLGRAVIASCRAQDGAAVSSYLGRFLDVTKGDIPDSVRQELHFFIGPAQLELIQQSARLEANPDDAKALLAFTRASILNMDINSARATLKKAVAKNPGILADESVARSFSALWGVEPFEYRNLENGWDGSRSRDGSLVFIRDLGTPEDRDRYIFRNSGNGDIHTMKGAQQGLRELALPRFSPDGNWIYFYSSTDKNWRPGNPGRFNLYRVKPSYGSAPIKLTDDDLIFSEPYLNTDGSILLVRKDVGSVRQSAEVFKVYPDQRRSESVIRIAEPVQWAVFTPKADSLLFITSRGLFKRSLSGGAITVEMAGQKLAYPTLSPDGKWLLVQGPQNDQILFDRKDGSMIFLGKTSGQMGWFGENGSLIITRGTDNSTKLIEYDLNHPENCSGNLLAKIRQEG